jgi:hypothetical protein
MIVCNKCSNKFVHAYYYLILVEVLAPSVGLLVHLLSCTSIHSHNLLIFLLVGEFIKYDWFDFTYLFAELFTAKLKLTALAVGCPWISLKVKWVLLTSDDECCVVVEKTDSPLDEQLRLRCWYSYGKVNYFLPILRLLIWLTKSWNTSQETF